MTQQTIISPRKTAAVVAMFNITQTISPLFHLQEQKILILKNTIHRQLKVEWDYGWWCQWQRKTTSRWKWKIQIKKESLFPYITTILALPPPCNHSSKLDTHLHRVSRAGMRRYRSCRNSTIKLRNSWLNSKGIRLTKKQLKIGLQLDHLTITSQVLR